MYVGENCSSRYKIHVYVYKCLRNSVKVYTPPAGCQTSQMKTKSSFTSLI